MLKTLLTHSNIFNWGKCSGKKLHNTSICRFHENYFLSGPKWRTTKHMKNWDSSSSFFSKSGWKRPSKIGNFKVHCFEAFAISLSWIKHVKHDSVRTHKLSRRQAKCADSNVDLVVFCLLTYYGKETWCVRLLKRDDVRIVLLEDHLRTTKDILSAIVWSSSKNFALSSQWLHGNNAFTLKVTATHDAC